MRGRLALAALAGLALRVFFVWRFPSVGGDTPTYESLARNWLDHGVYGIFLDGRLVPTDLRSPGYPAFLSLLYLVFGRSRLAVMAAQALVDLATCFLIVALAARLVPGGAKSETARERAALAGMWLGALCPFTANYVAVPLSEVLATFFTALTLLLLVDAWERSEAAGSGGFPAGRWLLAGIAAGLGTLVRPETPLLVAAAGIVLAAHWTALRQWQKIVRGGLWLAAGVLLALLPWGARNFRTLGRLQFLSARYAELPGEYVPHGFYSWTRTWLVRFRDVYKVPWKLEDEEIKIDDLPASAFDSPEERARVAALLEEYNNSLTVAPQLDAQFEEIARERTRRHPLRTYVTVPLGRAATMWLTPRTEQLPYSGHLWPLGEAYEDDPVDFSVTLALGAMNIVYLALGVTGTWMVVRRRGRSGPWFALSDATSRGVALLVVFIAARTVFFTQVETPEPRYLLECFPAVIALGALVPEFLRRPIRSASQAGGVPANEVGERGADNQAHHITIRQSESD
jgi:4-amino-4-deoxy-L-arabinose transferase-like glycosyltransferase